jgi:capsular exopolysaccharide synthesis family protein
MAKTYEALIKSKETTKDKAVQSSYLAVVRSEGPMVKETIQASNWFLSDTKTRKEISNLAQKITLEARNNDFKIFHFASSHKGEGTSSAVVKLAKFMMDQKSFRDVLLIDANLQHPILHLLFNVPPAPGLGDVLIKEVEYRKAIYRLGPSNIYLMPCGTPLVSNSSAFLQKKFSNFIAMVRNQYQYILIDSPPLLEAADAVALAVSSDTTFLVVEAHTTQWEVAEKTKNYLQTYDCDISGVILNRVMNTIPGWLYKRL